jgi:uncharacterized membrane protein
MLANGTSFAVLAPTVDQRFLRYNALPPAALDTVISPPRDRPLARGLGPMDSPSRSAPTRRSPNRLLRLTDSVVEALRSWGILLILIGITPGLAAWPLLNVGELSYVVENDLASDLRKAVVAWMALSFVIVLGFYSVAQIVLRSRGLKLTFGQTAKRLNRYTFVVISAPFLTALFSRGIETQHEFLTLVFIGVITGIFAVFIHRVLANRPDLPAHRELIRVRWLPLAMLALIGAYYAGYLSYMALLDHRNLGTHIYDLGIYDNIVWNTTYGDFLGCAYCKGGKHMSAHFDPVLWFLTPFYRLYPRAETLLVFQSVWLATGVIPLYLITKRRLANPWLGVLLALVYAFYPALHGANMFDFHSLTLVVPTLMWAIYLVDVGAVWRYAVVLALMLMTREDMPLLACFIGVYAIVQRRPVAGLVTILVALAYLAVVKLYIMPDPGLLMNSKDSMSYIYFYEDMIPHPEEGLRGLVITFFTNPGFVLKVLFMEAKIFFFLALLVPLLFLPAVAGPKRVVMLYGLVFLGLASRKHVFSLHFQYSSVLFPVLLMSMPDAIDRASRSRVALAFGLRQRRVVWTLAWTALVATLLTSFKFGGMIPNDHFYAGWNRLSRVPGQDKIDRYAFVREVVASIPPDASVCSTSALGPHVSARKNLSKWPSIRDADYLFLQSEGFKKADERRLERLVRRGAYRKVQAGHGIELYEKVEKVEKGDKDEEAEPKRSVRKRVEKGKRPVVDDDEDDHEDDEEGFDDPRHRNDDGPDDERESSAPDEDD